MLHHIKNIRPLLWIIIIVDTVLLGIRFALHVKYNWTLDLGIIVGNILMFLYVADFYEEQQTQRQMSISSVLGKSTFDALLFGEVGVVVYNDEFEIMWISDLLVQRNYQVIGQKLMQWLPETKAIFNNEAETIRLSINEHTYEATKVNEASTLILKDITLLNETILASSNKQIVLGMVHFDNYEETTQFEDEHTVTLIDSKIRQAVYVWANEMGIFIKRLRNNRMILVLTEELFQKAYEDRFSIVDTIRKEAEEIDVSITLTMAFSRGSTVFSELEDMVNTALSLAQNRGGDQVAIKTLNEDVIYVGGSSEAQAKKSKVRARVIAQTLRELILNSRNVLIMGHKEMDFDCFGSALVMSRFVYAYQKPVAIIMSDHQEEKLELSIEHNREELTLYHNFVDEHQARQMLDDETLLILVDHHSESYSQFSKLLHEAKHIVILDHHRRNQDFTFNPMLVYTETSASSTSEMVSELITYHQYTVPLTPIEATFIFTGLVVDTNRFRNRSGSRTFEVASLLKKYGADSTQSDEFLKENLKDFQLKSALLSQQKIMDKGIIIAYSKDDVVLNRTILSQVADSLLLVDKVEASFTVGRINGQYVGISARSNGNINVHAIMEKMQGSGHFNAAALQRENANVKDLLNELERAITDILVSEE